MFDETKAAASCFAETAAMIGLFARAAYYINKLLRNIDRKSEKEKASGQGWKVLSFIIPALVCILVLVGLNLPSQNKSWQSGPTEPPAGSISNVVAVKPAPAEPSQPDNPVNTVQDSFVFLKGGIFPL